MTKHLFKIAFFVALAALAITSVTMLIWNLTVPSLFNGPEITFLQTLGILILSRILFGGWKKGWGHHHYCGSNRGYWKSKMEQRWAAMSPEEKEKFKMKFAHCGWNMEQSETK